MPTPPPRQDRDPILWCATIALAFLALAAFRLGIPSHIYFDEVHYVPAARQLLLLERANAEHPLFAKELIAAAIALLGDRPAVWRLPSLLLGAWGLFACGRLMWWASRRRFATLAAMVLLASGFAWFIQSRIAMLDMVAASLCLTALWHCAAALEHPAPRARLAVIGGLMGLSLGAKWNVAPALMLPGIALLALRLRREGRGVLTASTHGPLRGISLIEGALWLGLLPLVVYWLTYLPAFFWHDDPVHPLGFIDHHRRMLDLQDSVTGAHPYRSVWYHWAVNWRAIWYLYEVTGGAQRGVLLIGNPLTMLAGLPALAWCLWAGLRRGHGDALAFAALYLVSMALWIVTTKPVQFYYHYLMPGTFLLGCLALALDEMWQSHRQARWLALAVVAASLAVFAWFYPILSAAPLPGGRMAYAHWMWLSSWR